MKYMHGKDGDGLYRITDDKKYEYFDFVDKKWEKSDNIEVFFYGENIPITEEEANEFLEKWGK